MARERSERPERPRATVRALRFGTDGVRAVANTELTPAYVLDLGRAAARVLVDSAGGRGPILVGRDTRRSGPLLEGALAAGIAAEGVDVELLGVAPDPGRGPRLGVGAPAGGGDHGIPQPVLGQRGQALRGRRPQAPRRRRGPHRGRAPCAGRADRRGQRRRAHPPPPGCRRVVCRAPVPHVPLRRPGWGQGGRRRRQRCHEHRRTDRPRPPGGDRPPDPRRTGRHQHQRPLRRHVPGGGGGCGRRARRRCRSGLRRRRRPPDRGRPPRPGRRRRSPDGVARRRSEGERPAAPTTRSSSRS